jgi:hypothetical protein
MPFLSFGRHHLLAQMPPIVFENGPNYLTYATIQNRRDPNLAAYVNACASNNISSALSLVATLDARAVTSGLNMAVLKGDLELARQLLTAGAKWDAFTINYASSSFDAVKLLVKCGYDVNTGLIGGGALLVYVPYFPYRIPLQRRREEKLMPMLVW